MQHGPTWPSSVGASSVPSADPQGCALVCLTLPGQPWPYSVALCHLLSTDVVTCWARRSTRAPGVLPLKCICLSRSPRLAAVRVCPAPRGVEARVPLLSQMCPAGVLGPTSEPARPSTGVSPSELQRRTMSPSWTEHGGSFGLAAGRVGRPAQDDHPPPFSPRGVSLPPPFTQHPARQAPCAHLGFPGGAVVKNQPANAGSCKRCKFDP